MTEVTENNAWLERRTAALNLRDLAGRALTGLGALCVTVQESIVSRPAGCDGGWLGAVVPAAAALDLGYGESVCCFAAMITRIAA
jgi:hypothetical protein